MAPGLLTVVAALGTCLTLCLVILMLAVVFFRKDPLCCKFRPDRTEHRSDEPHHYHSRHSLITITPAEPNPTISPGAAGPQLSGRLFIIGKPNDYYLSGGLPRLPSYESVRKKDRQRQIHHMISQRFGLFPNEPPPPYEETLHESAETSPPNLHTLDVHLSVHDHDSSHLHEDTNITNRPSSSLHDSQPSCSRAHSFMFSPSDRPAGPYQTM